MTQRVVTVRGEDRVATAVARLIEFGFSALPVVDARNRLVGIISLIDVLRHRENGGDDQSPVTEVMQPDVITLPPTANLNVVAHRLRTYGELRMMPITEKGLLVGVVTRSDLLRSRFRPSPFERLLHRFRGGDAAEELPSASAGTATATKGTTVRDIMVSDFPTVHPTESVDEVAKRLVEHRFVGLPVVDANNRLVGFVSEADLLGSEPLSGRSARRIDAVMSRDIVALAPDDTIADARLLFVKHGLRTVPVVENNIVVGMLRRADLIRVSERPSAKAMA